MMQQPRMDCTICMDSSHYRVTSIQLHAHSILSVRAWYLECTRIVIPVQAHMYSCAKHFSFFVNKHHVGNSDLIVDVFDGSTDHSGVKVSVTIQKNSKS